MVLFMPTYCLNRIRLRSSRGLLRVSAVVALGCVLPGALAQTLAHPGMTQPNMSMNIWWKHAFVYVIDLQAAQTGGLKGVTARMDALQGLGVDAVLLRGLQTGEDASIDPAAGTTDDFDEVLREASRHTLRILVELRPKSTDVDVSGVARFWLSRGVAGFRLVASGDSGAQMAQLRNAAKSYVGARVMIGDAVERNGREPWSARIR